MKRQAFLATAALVAMMGFSLPLSAQQPAPAPPAVPSYAAPPAWTPPPVTPAPSVAPLPAPAPLPTPTTCAQCLSPVSPDDVFCGVCGYRLK